MYAFGYNKNGTLGTGSFDDVTTPVQIDNKHSISCMVLGYDPKTVSNTTGTQMVQDEVSREYSKVENNCVSYNEDRGLVFDFNERRDYFNAGNTHTSVLKSGTFSISFWCNLRAHTSTEYRGRNGMLVSNWYSSTSSASNNAFIVYSTGTFVSGGGNTFSTILDESGSAASLPLDAWLHCAYVLNNGKLEVYINGEKQLISNKDHTHTFSNNRNLPTTLGILYHNKKYSLDGMMDDLDFLIVHLREKLCHYIKMIDTMVKVRIYQHFQKLKK